MLACAGWMVWKRGHATFRALPLSFYGLFLSDYLCMSLSACLIGSFKFFQETCVVLREQAQVVDTVLQVGDTFDTHTQCIA